MDTRTVALALAVPALGACAMLTATQPASAVTLYVAPDGNDAWSGQLERPNAAGNDGPLASLAGARDAVRALKRAGPLAASVTVEFADGVYPLEEAVVFAPQDSGTAERPITYGAAPGARPVFEGGRQVTGFQRGEGELWVAHIPQVADGTWTFEQLWVNGVRAVRARTPNRFYYYTTRKPGYGPDPDTGQVVDLANRAFMGRPEDIEPLVGLSPDELRNVCLIAYHAWEASRHRIAAVAADTGRIITTGNAPWPSMMWGPPQRYVLENLREALDEPGEWYLDPDGTLTYWPRPGENMANARVVAPALEELVRFSGEPDAGLPVEWITLRGLSFQHNQWLLPPEGHGDSQAAVTIPAAIVADGARSVTLDDCEIAHTSTYGLWFRNDCRDCSITRCDLHDLGAGGIKIGLTSIAPEDQQTGHVTADNNIIRTGGRLFPGAIGIWVGQSGDNQVTHNDVSDFYYTGISVGWSWGYADTASKRNRIEFNHIHHLGLGVMSDMGGVYTLGIADGTAVSNNVIHDVYSYDRYGYGGLGLYNDEGTTHITMENNLVYDIKDMTYHQHYGKENLVRNNILAFGRDYQISVYREEPHLSATFERNIVYFDSGKLFWAPTLGDRKLSFNHNLYWNAAGQPFDFMGLSFAEWQALGQDIDSLIQDPLFVDPDNYDFHLRPGSPALALGFHPFDYTQAGVYGDPDWVARARDLKYPPVEVAPDPPPPPPLEIDEDFDLLPVGAKPLDAQVNLENKGDSILVSNDRAVSGTHSLKFTDVDGLDKSFNPHLVYNPGYTEGTAHCSFDVLLGEGAELWHEYRDWSAQPYTVGPNVNIVEGKLRAGERELMDVPMGEWLHLDITCPLGDAAGTWSVRVTVPGEAVREFADLPVATPGWNKLTWVGLVSNATHASAFYIDNLKLINERE